MSRTETYDRTELLKQRQQMMADKVIRPFVERLIAEGVLPKPEHPVKIVWPGWE
jgi:hypothetical protein